MVRAFYRTTAFLLLLQFLHVWINYEKEKLVFLLCIDMNHRRAESGRSGIKSSLTWRFVINRACFDSPYVRSDLSCKVVIRLMKKKHKWQENRLLLIFSQKPVPVQAFWQRRKMFCFIVWVYLVHYWYYRHVLFSPQHLHIVARRRLWTRFGMSWRRLNLAAQRVPLLDCRWRGYLSVGWPKVAPQKGKHPIN